MVIKTFFDMCSGIGGGRLGLEKAGLKSVGRSDTSRLSDETYKLMFNPKDEKNWGNLKKIKFDQVPAFDLLIAGFPCQTFSVIGRKAGFSDIRGQIIFHIAEILKERQPHCFILENVRGLITHNKGQSLKTILELLCNSGYDISYKVLTSLDYGVPQMRQRVYFVGVNKKLQKDISKFEWPSPVKKPLLKNYLIDNCLADASRLEILKYYLKNPENKGEYSVADLLKMEGKILDTRMSDLRIYEGRCPTLRSQRDGILYVKNGKIYQLTGYEALLLQGFPKRYANRVRDKVTDRHLLMQAGNAMTVNVISCLGKQIIEFLK